GMSCTIHCGLSEGGNNVRHVLSRHKTERSVLGSLCSSRRHGTNHLQARIAGDCRSRVGPFARPYPYRSLCLIVLFLIGLCVLGAAGGTAERSPMLAAPRPMGLATPIATPQHQSGTQVGNGEEGAHPATTAAFCLPTDLTCLLNQAAQWV